MEAKAGDGKEGQQDSAGWGWIGEDRMKEESKERTNREETGKGGGAVEQQKRVRQSLHRNWEENGKTFNPILDRCYSPLVKHFVA